MSDQTANPPPVVTVKKKYQGLKVLAIVVIALLAIVGIFLIVKHSSAAASKEVADKEKAPVANSIDEMSLLRDEFAKMRDAHALAQAEQIKLIENLKNEKEATEKGLKDELKNANDLKESSDKAAANLRQEIDESKAKMEEAKATAKAEAVAEIQKQQEETARKNGYKTFDMDSSELKSRWLGFETRGDYTFAIIKNSTGKPTPMRVDLAPPIETKPDADWVPADYKLPNGIIVQGWAYKQGSVKAVRSGKSASSRSARPTNTKNVIP